MIDRDQLPQSLKGVLPVFQTPFHNDESLDIETLERELSWLLDMGVAGVVMAMVSEVLRLSHVERKQLAEHVCGFVGDRCATVISVGAESTHTAVDLAIHAESIGAHAVMAIPPVATAPLKAELHSYYEQLLRAVAIPVIVQDASGYVGRPMSIELQAKLLDAWGDRVQFKPEASPVGPRLSALRDATQGKARVFEGSGGMYLVDSYHRGVVGTMPGADLARANLALWNALEDGDRPRTDQISLPLIALVSLQTSLDAFLAIEKHLLVRQGIFSNTVIRGPVGFQLDDETRSEVDRLFDLLEAALNETNSNSDAGSQPDA